MLLFPVALVAGVVAGYLAGGRLRLLGRVELRHAWLLAAAVGVQLGLGAVPPGARLPLALASHAAAGAWLVVNARGRGALRAPLFVAAAGWLANMAVMAANGGMPVSRAALAAAGMPGDMPVESGHLFKHVAAGDATLLPWLGDVIPVAPLSSVVSAGDVVLAAGIAAFVAVAMRARAAAPAVRPASVPVAA